MTRVALGCAALLLLGACDDGDDGGGGTEASASTSAGSSGGDDSTGLAASTTGEDTTSGTTTDGSEEGTAANADGTTTGGTEGDESSTEGGNACNPVVPGEYNACMEEGGDIDNTLCNWMGSGQSVGTVSCLSGPTEGSNVCMINGCVDDCDCFAPPATGDAPSVCREVIEGGGMACILACDQGETCPEGMTCESGICFHIPDSSG